MNKFRLLRADEIDCRIAQIRENGLSLLLYKDARVDQNILDETVGEMNWQKSYSRDNANCVVSIWDEAKKMWISKEDTGTESNTEKERDLLPTPSSVPASAGGSGESFTPLRLSGSSRKTAGHSGRTRAAS